MEYELVWLSEERTFAELIQLGAYMSIVRYNIDGLDYEVFIDNDEFEHLEGEDDEY